MKKLVALALALVMVLGIVSACNDTTDPTTATTTAKPAETTPGVPVTTPATLSGDLNILSFTNELKVMSIAFEARYPDIVVNYDSVNTTDGLFQEKAQAVANTDACPDVIALEAAFVKEFVDQDNFLMDISDLMANATEMETYENSIKVGTAPNGEIRAFSYQYTPGAFFYRRSLAKKYLGSDDPAEVQKFVADWDSFKTTAEKISKDSNGSVKMLSGVDELTRPYYANRSQGWVIDGKLNIDPKLDELLEMAKYFADNDYVAGLNQWQEGWQPSMGAPIKDADGKDIEVFSYFMPTWGVTYLLATFSTPNNFGDYAICKGPVSWQWGGTWVGVMKNAKNVENAKAFVQFVCLDEENLTNWATGVYTWDYLYAINPIRTGEKVLNEDGSVKEALSQGAGDFVSSKVVINKLLPNISTPVLGGQNNYQLFDEVLGSVKVDLMTGYDQRIEDNFVPFLRAYAMTDDYATIEEVYDAFKTKIAGELPQLIVE